MKRMVVDSEHFDVSERFGEPGVYDLRWVSGPNPGYGFATSSSGRRGQSDGELEDAIRTFLAQVNPETGYIE